MFALFQLLDGRVGSAELGTVLDPALDGDGVIERMCAEDARRADELWDVPGHVAREKLTRMLVERNVGGRALAAAARALGALHCRGASELLIALLSDGDEHVGIGTVEALARVGSSRLTEAIRAASTVGSQALRRAVATTLAALGAWDHAEPLLQAVVADEELVLLARERHVRARSLDTGSVGPADLVRSYIESRDWRDLLAFVSVVGPRLEATSGSPRFSDEARIRAAALLLIRGWASVGLEAVPFLTRKHISLEARRELVVGMGRSRIAEAVPKLITLLDHPDQAMQEAAVIALGRIGRSAALGPLLTRWDAREGALRPLILVALRRLCSVDGAEYLRGFLEYDSDPLIETAVFVGDDGELAPQLPRPWLVRALSAERPEARRDAALLLALFGDASDAPALEALARREQDADVKAIAARGHARLARGGRSAPVEFGPWPT